PARRMVCRAQSAEQPASPLSARGRSRTSMACCAGTSALLPAPAERGERLGRHHAALGLRAVHERALVPREAILPPTERGGDPREFQRAVPSVRGSAPRIPARAAAQRIRHEARAEPRPIPELRELLFLRPGGGRFRERARSLEWRTRAGG